MCAFVVRVFCTIAIDCMFLKHEIVIFFSFGSLDNNSISECVRMVIKKTRQTGPIRKKFQPQEFYRPVVVSQLSRETALVTRSPTQLHVNEILTLDQLSFYRKYSLCGKRNRRTLGHAICLTHKLTNIVQLIVINWMHWRAWVFENVLVLDCRSWLLLDSFLVFTKLSSIGTIFGFI